MNWNKHLTITHYDQIGYVWTVDGQFRTVTSSHPRFTDGTPVILGMRYRIPNPDGNSWKMDCVGCHIPLGDFSRYIPQHYIENPMVSFQGLETMTDEILKQQLISYTVVELPHFRSNDFISIENTLEYHHLFAQWIHPDENGLLNTTMLEGSDQCRDHPNFRQPLPMNDRDAPPGTVPTVFGRSIDVNTGEVHVFAYDPHLALRENTLENPLEDGGGDLVMDTDGVVAGEQVLCQNVEMNFLNEKYCRLSYSENACRPNSLPRRVIVLNKEKIASISAMTGRKLFVVTGFSLTDIDGSTGMPHFRPPCRHGRRTSRWKKIDDASCANTADLGAATIKTFRDLIDVVSSDGSDQYYNPDIIDVTRNVLECDIEDAHKYQLGNVRASDGSCWTHVHPYEQSVFDLTGMNSDEYTVIGDNMASLSSDLLYKRIVVNDSPVYPLLGTLGDHVVLDGKEVPPLDDEMVQRAHESMDYNPSKRAVLICGSPGEVASDPFYGDQGKKIINTWCRVSLRVRQKISSKFDFNRHLYLGFDVVVPESTGYRTTSIWQLAAQRHTVWTHLALHAKDQLRQRVAWALSQIIPVGIITVGGSRVHSEKTEPFLELYDQFVRHGFGSYRDLMREFSYNVLMAEWLSFVDNKSLQWNIMNGNGPNYPDENFAREIMQLFR